MKRSDPRKTITKRVNRFLIARRCKFTVNYYSSTQTNGDPSEYGKLSRNIYRFQLFGVLFNYLPQYFLFSGLKYYKTSTGSDFKHSRGGLCVETVPRDNVNSTARRNLQLSVFFPRYFAYKVFNTPFRNNVFFIGFFFSFKRYSYISKIKPNYFLT